ncbi:MAG: hypothetical protein AAB692_01455, partial [Patescibacteria group bacterium]
MPDDRRLVLPFSTLEELIEDSRRARGADPKPLPPRWWQIYRNWHFSCDLNAGGTDCGLSHDHERREGRLAGLLIRVGLGLGALVLGFSIFTPLPFSWALAITLGIGAGFSVAVPYLHAKACWKAHRSDRESSDVMLTDGEHMLNYLKAWLNDSERAWLGKESPLQIALMECEGKLNMAADDAIALVQQLASAVGDEAKALFREAQRINLEATEALIARKRKILT